MPSAESLTEVFARAGCQGSVHASTVDGGREVGAGSDDPVAPASVVKVLVALEVETQVADGRLDPAARVRITEAERTRGPVGMSLFRDDAEVSVRDLVALMLTLSDNVATDALLDRVGTRRRQRGRDPARAGVDPAGPRRPGAGRLDPDRRRVRRLGRVLRRVDIPGAGVAAALDERLVGVPALQPDGPWRTTARDMTRLLALVWTDQGGPAAACARVRELMSQQLTRHRIAHGFGPAVGVAAKSGGLMGVLRNEVGVVTFPDGGQYAVSVFTRSDSPRSDERPVNAAIGEAAAAAVGLLR